MLKLLPYVKKLGPQLSYQQKTKEKNREDDDIREYEVLLRLRSFAVDQNFCYYMNNQCYKQYTLKKTE